MAAIDLLRTVRECSAVQPTDFQAHLRGKRIECSAANMLSWESTGPLDAKGVSSPGRRSEEPFDAKVGAPERFGGPLCWIIAKPYHCPTGRYLGNRPNPRRSSGPLSCEMLNRDEVLADRHPLLHPRCEWFARANSLVTYDERVESYPEGGAIRKQPPI